MRLGIARGPLRATIAGMSLAGLAAAFLLPQMAVRDQVGQDVDPITTASVDKTASGEPTVTDIPPTLESMPAEAAPRQVLPQASTVDVTMDPSDPIVDPVMTNDEPEIMAADEMAAAAQTAVAATSNVPQDGMASLQNTSGVGEAMGGSAITLALDHARVMQLVGDVSTIIIGNPAIADAAMPDPQTLVLTGKSYGETNMVMLDEDGVILGEQVLQVTVRGQSLVSVYRGVNRTTLSCAPTCEIRPTPGDTSETLSAGMEAFRARNAAALEAVAQQ